ncbi:hypothetical protein LJC02_01915 [Breznakia sp. OttesenSCG-928-G09]|nr:hypothetical protein [Breznakia sp. OttesenSCG-928-G09]
MADGKIRIDTAIDNTAAEEELKDLLNLAENNADAIGEKLTNSVSKVAAEYNVLVAKQEEVNAKAERQKQIMDEMVAKQATLQASGTKMDIKQANSMQPEIDGARAKYSKLVAQSDAYNAKLDAAKIKASTLADEIDEVANGTESAGKSTDKLNSKLKDGKDKANGLSKSFDGAAMKASAMQKASDVSGSINRGLRSVAKIALALFSIRTIYTTMTRAANSFINANNKASSQIRANIDYMWNAIGNALAPVIQFVVNLVYTLLTLLNSVLMTFFGINIFANAVADSTSSAAGGLADANKEAKELKKQLAGFDEMNVLQGQDNSDSGSGGGGGGGQATPAPSFDTSFFDKILDDIKKKITEFLAWFTSDMDFAPLKASLDNLLRSFNHLGEGIALVGKTFVVDFVKPLATYVINDALPHFLNSTAEAIKRIDFTKINAGFKELWKALLPFTITLFEGLLWFYDNVLIPIALWTINDVLPAFLKILAGVINVLNSAINALKPLFIWFWNNVLSPIAAWTGGVIVAVLNAIASALNGISNWINKNQSLFSAMIVTLGAFFAAWKVANLVAFIKEGGGVVSVLTKMITENKLLNKIWNSNIVSQGRLMALWIKEKAAIIASTVATKAKAAAESLSNIATNLSQKATALATTTTGANTVAVTAQTAAMNIGALAAKAFGVAITFFTSPLGIATLAVGGLVAALAIFTGALGSTKNEMSAVEKEQAMFNDMFKESKAVAENAETSYSKLADEVLPKLADSWETMTSKLSKFDLTGHKSALNGLADQTKEYVDTAKSSITEYYDTVYQKAMTYYSESNVLSEAEERKNLETLATVQKEKLTKVDEHEKALLKLQNKLVEKGVLNDEERKQYQEHLDALNEIAINTLTPEQARQLGEQAAFLAKKGKLNEDERIKFAESLRTSEEEQLNIINTRYGQEIADTKEKYKILIDAADGNKEEIKKLENQKNEELDGINTKYKKKTIDNTKEHYNKLVEGVTGHSAKELKEWQKLNNEKAIIDFKMENSTDESQRRQLKTISEGLGKKMEKYNLSNIDIERLNSIMNEEGNEAYNTLWKSQVEKTSVGTKDVKELIKKLSKDFKVEGADKIKKTKGDFNAAGQSTVDGITQGVNDGKSRAINAMGTLAQNMLTKAKEMLEIKSPSRVMRKLFRWVPLGAALGVEDESGKVTNSTAGMIANAIDSASNLVGSFVEVGKEAAIGLASELNESIDIDDKSVKVNATVTTLSDAFNKFADVISRNIDKLITTPMKVETIPSLPLGSVVNIPKASIPFQNHYEVNDDRESIRDLIQELMNNGGFDDSDKVINLYIDGEKLFKWFIRKKKEQEFATNGGVL